VQSVSTGRTVWELDHTLAPFFRRKMKRNGVLILLTIVLLTVVSLLTLHLPYEGIREALSLQEVLGEG